MPRPTLIKAQRLIKNREKSYQKSAGCFVGYGENKQKGDNEGGLKTLPSQHSKVCFYYNKKNQKCNTFYKNFF